MEKIIFLDIDGVLNATGDKFLIEDTFEPYRLRLLVKLIRNTNSRIVVISSRIMYEDERNKIERVFDNYNIKVDYINKIKEYAYRFYKVINYLVRNDYSNFVILDDNDFGYSNNEILCNHFVSTIENGFGEPEYDKALSILNGEIKYKVKINNKITQNLKFDEAKTMVLSIIKNNIENNNDVYSSYFSSSILNKFNRLKDKRIITDEEIILKERIEMLMKDLIYDDNNKIIPYEYIQKDHSCRSDKYSLFIKRKYDGIYLELENNDDYLYTNMFNMRIGFNYYFESHMVVSDKTYDLNIKMNCML